MNTSWEIDPTRMSATSQMGIAALYGLGPGWYLSVDLARAMAGACGNSVEWATNVLRDISKNVTTRRREKRKQPGHSHRLALVLIDPAALRIAWPAFDPTTHDAPRLELQPVEPA